MAGIAVFPTVPARSPAMSSLPLAVERIGPVFHAHTDPWLALSTTVQPLRAAIAERPVSTTPSVPNPQSPSFCSHRHKTQSTTTNTHSASTGILQSHIQYERGIPRESFRRQSEPHSHFPLSSGHFHFFVQRRHVSSASSSCGYLRAFLIYLSIAKPQCWAF